MELLLALLLVAALAHGLFSNLAVLLREWRHNRAAFIATMRLVAVYVAYCAVGIWVTIRGIDGPAPPLRAFGGTLLLTSWILYGAVWLARTAPRTQPVPGWLARFPGAAEGVLAATVAVGGVMYFA